MRKCVIILYALLMLMACSVKENRIDCPVLLDINMQEVYLSYKNINNIRISLFEQELDTMLHSKVVKVIDGSYQFKVPKNNIRLLSCVYSPKLEYSANARMVYLKTGYEVDSLYTYSNIKSCFNEKNYDTLHLTKQWCTIQIILEEPDKWKSSIFMLSGDWAGLNIIDSKPLKGKLFCEPRWIKNDRLEVRVPRQGDNSLRLMVYNKNTNGERGVLSDVFELGDMIYQAGYDWNRTNLDDIIIVLSYKNLNVGVHVVDWEALGDKKYWYWVNHHI